RGYRALPVRPADVDGIESPVRIIHTGEKLLRPFEPPVDSPGDAGEEPGGEIIQRRPFHSFHSLCAWPEQAGSAYDEGNGKFPSSAPGDRRSNPAFHASTGIPKSGSPPGVPA